MLSNQSKETTAKEMGKIKDIDETTQRAIGINLTGGHVNALEISCAAFKAPTLDTLLQAFKEQLPKSRAKPELTQALLRESDAGHTGFEIPNFDAAAEEAVEIMDPITQVPVLEVEVLDNVTGAVGWD